LELREAGLISKLPRMAVIQAAGANPLYTAWNAEADLKPIRAETIATAIKIGAPVSWRKSVRGLKALDGVVTEVSDNEIMDAKARVDASGIGAEPASCATVAGVERLVREGVIGQQDHVVGVLTGNLMKDPDVVVGYHTDSLDGIRIQRANPPVVASANVDAIRTILRS
jgi:threonine synthase